MFFSSYVLHHISTKESNKTRRIYRERKGWRGLVEEAEEKKKVTIDKQKILHRRVFVRALMIGRSNAQGKEKGRITSKLSRYLRR